MKKRYLQLVVMLTLSSLLGVSAQAQWSSQSNDEKAAQQRAQQAESAEINISYCSMYDYIYPYDGLSLDYDARVGVGAKFTRDMFEDYIGGVITAMYVGWSDENSTAVFDCFVRTDSFTGTSISTGEATVGLGWNRVEMSRRPIPDTDALYVGFYTDLIKDVVCIPDIYPSAPNSVFLYSGETDSEGNEMWYDMSGGLGKMSIMLTIMDPTGKFANLVKVTDIRANTIVWRDDVHDASIRIKNAGSNELSSIEVTTTFGDMTMADEIVFEEALLTADEGWIKVPIYCLGTGVHDISFTKVNGKEPKNIQTQQVEMLGVPYDYEGKYRHLPLIEYFVSEENYMYPRYYEQMFKPAFEPYKDAYNLVFQHLDDKYMWGDNEAIVQMLSLCNNDSSKIYVPGFTVNRSDYIEYLAPLYNTPFHNGTPFPEVANDMWSSIKDNPTFASVNVSAQYDESLENINIEVSGNVAEGVMPEGEPLYLTVYLMEKNVVSEDQLFWDDADIKEHEGEFTHPNVVRDILTEYWGDELPQTGGDYSLSFATTTYPDWNSKNLYVVAFLNRGEENGHMSRQIINSAKANINWPQAVYGVEEDSNVKVTTLDGAIYFNGTTEGVEVYNLAGARLDNGSLANGVYLAKSGNVVAKVVVK